VKKDTSWDLNSVAHNLNCRSRESRRPLRCWWLLSRMSVAVAHWI